MINFVVLFELLKIVDIMLSSTTFMDVCHPKTFYLYLYTQNER